MPLTFFCSRHAAHRDVHSFPTRRSSDLGTTDRAVSVHGVNDDLSGEDVPRWEPVHPPPWDGRAPDRKSTRLNSSHAKISYAVFCFKTRIVAGLDCRGGSCSLTTLI